MNPDFEHNQTLCLQNHSKSKIPTKQLVVPSANFIIDKLRRRKICVKGDKIMLEGYPNDKDRIKMIAKLLHIHQWHKVEDLKLWGRRISNEGTKAIGLELSRHLHRQERLSIDICLGNKVTAKGAQALTSKIARNFTQLRELHVCFLGCQSIDDQALQIIGVQMARNLSQLRKLELEFPSCDQITDNGVEALISETAPYWNKLRYLSLNFSGCFDVTDRGVEALILDLAKHLKNIETLSLELSGCSLTKESLETLGLQLAQHFIKLQSLDWCSDDLVIEQGIQVLASGMAYRINQNRPLEICFPGITVDVIQELTNSIQFVPSLMFKDILLCKRS